MVRTHEKGSHWVGESGQLGYLELQPWLGHCSERCGLPVGLLCLFPHDHIEAATVLVTEEETCVVIISDCVHMKSTFKVHAIEGCVSWGGSELNVRGFLVACSRVGMGRRCLSHVRPESCEKTPPPHLPSIGAFTLEITELGVPYIPTARPGSLFIV